MSCKQLTVQEFEALPPDTPGYDQGKCPSCNPCPCSAPSYCCNDGKEPYCMPRLTTGACNSIIFRKKNDGSDIQPGFKWMIQSSGGTTYSNEEPSPSIAEQTCPGGIGFWNTNFLSGVNPCGFGYVCHIYYKCINA